MKCKIEKIETYINGNRNFEILYFNFFEHKVSTALSKKAKLFLKVDFFKVGQYIEVVKNIKSNKICYVITKVYN